MGLLPLNFEGISFFNPRFSTGKDFEKRCPGRNLLLATVAFSPPPRRAAAARHAARHEAPAPDASPSAEARPPAGLCPLRAARPWALLPLGRALSWPGVAIWSQLSVSRTGMARRRKVGLAVPVYKCGCVCYHGKR